MGYFFLYEAQDRLPGQISLPNPQMLIPLPVIIMQMKMAYVGIEGVEPFLCRIRRKTIRMANVKTQAKSRMIHSLYDLDEGRILRIKYILQADRYLLDRKRDV